MLVGAKDMAGRIFKVGNIGAVLQFFLDDEPGLTHEEFCKRADNISTATLHEWLNRDSTKGIRKDTLASFAKGCGKTLEEFRQILREESGVVQAVVTLSRLRLVTDPDSWLLKMAKYFRRDPGRAKKIVDEILEASNADEAKPK